MFVCSKVEHVLLWCFPKFIENIAKIIADFNYFAANLMIY